MLVREPVARADSDTHNAAPKAPTFILPECQRDQIVDNELVSGLQSQVKSLHRKTKSEDCKWRDRLCRFGQVRCNECLELSEMNGYSNGGLCRSHLGNLFRYRLRITAIIWQAEAFTSLGQRYPVLIIVVLGVLDDKIVCDSSRPYVYSRLISIV